MSQATGLPTKPNPANVADKQLPERSRIPMSLPIQKLSAPEIPGFHTHWMKGDAQRISQALKAGYTFVEQDEVDLNSFGIANGEEDSGHSDLGSRVSIVSGTDEKGGAQRLYLMKLPQQYREQDIEAQEKQQALMAATLRGDKGFAQGGQDTSNRYVGQQSGGNQNLFQPKPKS